ncbi:MAG TPA: GreA/GreB family elongation factor [Candidatus Elarobacter sp.]|jgi:transcription elongation GreA/GreB family factor|nr:GreA/GreB family elongation factor [Candidatus Elarobacter sp.]
MSRAFTKERDDVVEEVVFVRARRKGADTPAPPADHGVAGFGATVVVEGVGKKASTFTIADADQTDLTAGRLGIDSPLAEAMIGARAGDTVVWHRPAGDLKLKIVSIRYD